MTVVKSALKKIVELDAPIDRGVVQSVDKDACTCVVQLVSNDGILDDVKLKAIINEEDTSQLGIILFPAVGSYVVVGQIDNDSIDIVVLGFTIIESISLDTATALKMLLSSDGNVSLNAVKMVFNDGNNGGIPLLNPLTQIILKLQQQVNQLITTFNAHTHAVVGEATSPTITPGPSLTAPLIKTTDIANTKILQ